MRLGLSLLPLRQISDNLITHRLILSDSTPLTQIIKRSQKKLLTCYKVAKDTNTPSYYAIPRSNQTLGLQAIEHTRRDALTCIRVIGVIRRTRLRVCLWMLALCVLMRKVACTVSCRPREGGGNEIVLPDWNH